MVTEDLKLELCFCPQDLVVITFLGNWPELNAVISSLPGFEGGASLIPERV